MGVFSMEPVKGLDHIQTAYARKDNPIEVILKEDEREYDYSTCQTIRAKIGTTVLDSTADTDAFDTSEAQVGKLKIFIGDKNIEAKAYNVKVEIVTANDHTIYFGSVRVRVENTGM